MLELEINNRYSRLLTPEAATIRLFERIQSSGQFPIGDGELSIVFVSDPEIARIHGDFMDDPSPTDVITFPADASMQSAGEIIVSVDHAQVRASQLQQTFSRELALYLIHGWLHLAGFDDRNDHDRAQMRKAETQALNLLDRSENPIEYKLS